MRLTIGVEHDPRGWAGLRQAGDIADDRTAGLSDLRGLHFYAGDQDRAAWLREAEQALMGRLEHRPDFGRLSGRRRQHGVGAVVAEHKACLDAAGVSPLRRQ